MSRPRRRSLRRSRDLMLGTAVAVAVLVPAGIVAGLGATGGQATQALLAANAWHDWVGGQRTPQVVPAGDTESAIVLLDGPSVVDTPVPDRDAALQRIKDAQLAVEGSVQGMGGVVTHRYRTLINGLAVRVPSGHLAALGEIKGISAVVPVRYLAPAAAAAANPLPTGDGGTGAATAPQPTGGAPAHIALIDSGVDASHPWLGGGMGADRLIIGGTDLVDDDSDPSPSATDPGAEAHGTQMASIILRSPALAGLPAAQTPRMIAFRVTSREDVAGQVRTLARSDRVLAALEMAADPNRDGLPADHADVIALGLARGFGGSGIDPVALALSAANEAGAVVVVPAGNDGPTGLQVGSVGQVASTPGVLSVGGMAGGTSPRTASLEASVGPAGASLDNLPLMGAEPGPAATGGAPLVAASGADGVGTGLDPQDFAGADGRSTVAGAFALVARSGAPLGDVARRAAAAGAVGVVVWDQHGTGAYPGVLGGADVPVPVVGLGSAQGGALLGLLRRNPAMAVTLTPHATQQEAPAVASFSSTGPSATGRVAPLVVAPAVAVEAAYPGDGTNGAPQSAPLTGTSAAAASVAAEALRLRVDHPGWTPADVRSVIAQTAGQVPGATLPEEGAGAAADPGTLATRSLPGVSIDPPLISGPVQRDTEGHLDFHLHDLTGTGGRYRVLMQADDGTYLPLGGVFDLAPGGMHDGTVTIPRGPEAGPATYRARLVVVPEGGEVAAGSAVVWASTRPTTPRRALGVPSVHHTGPGLGQVTVRVGMRDVLDKGLNAVTLHDVSVTLHPVGGSGSRGIRMSGAERSGDWPAGQYVITLARRDAAGAEVPPGRYRAVVTAKGPDGVSLGQQSAPFRVR